MSGRRPTADATAADGGEESALFRSHGREGRDELMHVVAAAMGTLNPGFVYIRDVVLLGEFFVTVSAMKGVLRHS
jgi:hypothetical protein